ncbi:MAG: ABC transporter permease [Gemmatimonadales bacterium]|nr:ABC transporter permease [Gemmatimonadales bacterium]
MTPAAPADRPALLPRALLALAVATLMLLVVGPLLRLLLEASPASLGAALADAEVRGAIGLTVLTASAATLLGVLLGVPVAWLLARRPFPGRTLVEGVLQLPVVVPHPVGGIALLLFFSRGSALGGALAQAGLEVVSHVPGIVVAMLFVSVPLVISGAREAFRGVDPRLERVARTLGDSGWDAVRRVTLPLAGRGILAAALLAWARAVSEFGSIVILTYHPKVAPVLIFDRFTAYGLEAAVPAAVLLLLVALGVFALVRLVERREAARA